jgi:hypothetical protein
MICEFSHACELESLYISVLSFQGFDECDGGIVSKIKYFICRYLNVKRGVLFLKTSVFV